MVFVMLMMLFGFSEHFVIFYYLSACIADAFLLWRNMFNMIGGAASQTSTSAGHSLYNVFIRNFYINRIVDFFTQFS